MFNLNIVSTQNTSISPMEWYGTINPPKIWFTLFLKVLWCSFILTKFPTRHKHWTFSNWANYFRNKIFGIYNEIFDLQFFSSLEPVWATDQWVKIFSILVQILRSYSKFRFEKLTSPGYHNWGVKKNFILGLWWHCPFKGLANSFRIGSWLA